jgi:hypothetical protein
MALTITHAKVSTAGPAADPDKVGGDDWNDDHVLTGDYLRKATVTLSSADILDLHNTPVTLVAAPGAGKCLLPVRVVSFMGTYTPYSSTSTAYPVLRFAGAATPSTPLTEDVSYGTPAFWSVPVGTISIDTTYAENVALVATTDGAQFTDGDGTLTVTVWYTIEDVPA